MPLFGVFWHKLQDRHRGIAAKKKAAHPVTGRRPDVLIRCAVAYLRPLPGNSLNGTVLSTRMSCGKPSTCSETILRKISSVPPAMR